MPPTTVEAFIQLLQTSNLLSAEKWDELRCMAGGEALRKPRDIKHAPVSLEPTASPELAQFAQQIVERGFVTRWQADMLLTGRKAFFLGRYQLLDHIGAGGMGAVFKSRHAVLDRLVALKLMAARLVDSPTALTRFHQEMQAAAALNHPNIVVAYDAESVGDTHFLVMEYIAGHDLGYLVRRDGPLPIGWACECLRQTAVGLQHAHELGMVHRDIKPSNLLVTQDPESGGPLVKILDMGIARFVSELREEEGVTETGQVLGTPDYISPEQAANTHDADIRSDIFSMGCTLFRLLTGQVPFGGTNVMQKLMARAMTDAPLLRTLRPDAPAELERVLAKMLARDVRERYQTPAEVAVALAPFTSNRRANEPPLGQLIAATVVPDDDSTLAVTRASVVDGIDPELEEFLRHLATEAEGADAGSSRGQGQGVVAGTKRQPAIDEPPRAKGRQAGEHHRRTIVWTAVACLLLLSCAGAASLWDRLGSTVLVIAWPAAERESATLAVDQRTINITHHPGSPIVIRGRAGLRQVSIHRAGYEPIEASLPLTRGERKEWSPHWKATPATARQIELSALNARWEKLSQMQDVNAPPAVDLRRDLVTFARTHAGTIEAREVRTRMAHLAWPLDQLSPDQIPPYELAAAGQGDAHRAPREIVGIFGDSHLKHWAEVLSVDSRDDGHLLASSSRDGTVRLWDGATGSERGRLLVGNYPIRCQFSPTGEVLATMGDPRGVVLWDVANGKLKKQLADTAAPVAFAWDGTLLATQSRQGGVALWNVGSGLKRQPAIDFTGKPLRSLAFSSGRKLLAGAANDRAVHVWDVETGKPRYHFAAATSPQFSPDGKWLAAGTAHGNVTLWSMESGQPARTLDEAGEPLAFSADGKWLTTQRTGRVLVWNLEQGTEVRTLRDVFGLTAVSADRKVLAAGDEHFGGLKFWDLETGVSRLAHGHPGAVTCLAFTRDSNTLLTGSVDHSVKLWHPATGAERLLAGSGIGPADLCPEGRTLVYATEDASLTLLDVSTRTVKRSLDGVAQDMRQITFSPDGKLIAGIGHTGSYRMTLRLWDAATGRELPLHDDAAGDASGVEMLAFSPDSLWLAAAGNGSVVRLWDVSKRDVKSTLEEHGEKVRALAFSPDGKLLAVARQNKSIHIWDIAARKERRVFAVPSAEVSTLVFDPDGVRLAAGTIKNRIHLWNVSGGELTATLSGMGDTLNSLSFSPDQSLLAGATNSGKIHFWDLAARHAGARQADRTLAIGPSGGIVSRVQFSPEGRHLLTVNGNGTLYILRLHERTSGEGPSDDRPMKSRDAGR